MSNRHLGRQTPQKHPPFFPLPLSFYFGAQRHLEWHTPLASCPSSVPLCSLPCSGLLLRGTEQGEWRPQCSAPAAAPVYSRCRFRRQRTAPRAAVREANSVPVTPTYPRAGESHEDGHRVIPSSGKIHVGNQLGWSWEVMSLLTLIPYKLPTLP